MRVRYGKNKIDFGRSERGQTYVKIEKKSRASQN